MAETLLRNFKVSKSTRSEIADGRRKNWLVGTSRHFGQGCHQDFQTETPFKCKRGLQVPTSPQKSQFSCNNWFNDIDTFKIRFCGIVLIYCFINLLNLCKGEW